MNHFLAAAVCLRWL